MRLSFIFLSLVISATGIAQIQRSSDVTALISVDAPSFALIHVRVIDGTGASAKEDQTVVISNGKVQLVGSAASIEIPQDAQRLDRAGYTLIPGIVGMHDHLYYTDSYSIQVSGGKVGEPGLFLADIPIRLPDSIWRLA